MIKYIIKRILQAIAVLLLVTCITFFLMKLVPGSPFASEKSQSPEVLEALNKKYGLDQPYSVQLKRFIVNALHGEFGVSLKMQKNRIKNTAQEILKKEGVKQKANVHFVQEKFPEKNYGQYTFPEGIYDAVRIDLGAAKGHNWWCVMFPDLCVTKDDKVRINNTARKKMEKLLGKKTIRKITKDKYLGWLFKV